MTTLAAAALDPAERRTLDRLVESLQGEFGDKLDAVWLYGSRARGDRHEESDVDLLVFISDPDTNRQRVWDLMFDAAKAEGARGPYFIIHVHDLEWLAERREVEDFFIQEVDRDKIVLFGKP